MDCSFCRSFLVAITTERNINCTPFASIERIKPRTFGVCVLMLISVVQEEDLLTLRCFRRVAHAAINSVYLPLISNFTKFLPFRFNYTARRFISSWINDIIIYRKFSLFDREAAKPHHSTILFVSLRCVRNNVSPLSPRHFPSPKYPFQIIKCKKRKNNKKNGMKK